MRRVRLKLSVASGDTIVTRICAGTKRLTHPVGVLTSNCVKRAVVFFRGGDLRQKISLGSLLTPTSQNDLASQMRRQRRVETACVFVLTSEAVGGETERLIYIGCVTR